MNEARDAPPFEGGSGGVLEIIDLLCQVTNTQAAIIKKQAYVIGQAEIASAINDELQKERDAADAQLDIIEYKMRGL